MKYARNVYNNIVDKLCKKRIVFHHVPKCGGNSIGKAIPIRYLLSRATINPLPSIYASIALSRLAKHSDVFQNDYDFRQNLFVYYLMQDYRFIWAHIEFNEIAYEMFGRKYYFLTVLRDPIERYISNFFYDRKYKPRSPFYISKIIDEFIGSEQGIKFGKRYCDYYSGLSPYEKHGENYAIDCAKKNLHKFDIVGFLHDTKKLELLLKKIIGIKVRIGHKNKGINNQARNSELITIEDMNRIKNACKADIEIYEYALSKFS